MGQENRPSREISESLRGFGGKHTDVDDEQIFAIFSGGDVDFLRQSYQQLEDRIITGEKLNTKLSHERQLEIVRALLEDVDKAKEWQDKIERENESEGVERAINPAEAQWATPATTPAVHLEYDSVVDATQKIDELKGLEIDHTITEQDGKVVVGVEGNRVSFAFWKKMCSYKDQNKDGCRFCMLSEKNRLAGDITPEQQLASLDDALNQTKSLGNRRTVFEILPDGSFLNPNEVPEDVQNKMMQRLGQEASIHRVAVETRPEFCNAERVRRLMDNLRGDQKLNIYFGLETTDEFVGSVIHKKGYGFKYFKERVSLLLSELSEEEKQRLELSVYNIIKPIYITEQESVDLAEQMAEDMDEFSREVGFEISIKYEPSVVSAGSFQDYLYNEKEETGERRFQPLSYLSVAELIARLSKKDLSQHAKFGQRDDIDNYSVVSMVPQIDDESLFSQFDFMVYNAVQRFNTSHDVRGFLVDMKTVVEHSEEFKKWEREFYGGAGKSELSGLIRESFSGETHVTREEEERIDRQKIIWQVCDAIEYNKDFSDILRKNGKNKENEIKTSIKELFDSKGIEVYGVKDFIFIDSGDQDTEPLSSAGTNPMFSHVSADAGYQIEVIVLNEKKEAQSVWVKIPLKAVDLPSRPEFIYKED
ncbi:hypothetical protein C0581_03720 [Candidatus Parcubacteria bacterium]|nr:MAG: hypothetical protein C0581_03720 [Candidatus Parcubacteria bacterium]